MKQNSCLKTTNTRKQLKMQVNKVADAY